MPDNSADAMLRQMAEHRGCRLVRSRRRTPGVGDYGRYGLKDASTGSDVMGFGPDGLTATAEEIEAFLRKGLVADWKGSLAAASAAPAPPARKAKQPLEAEPKPAPPSPPPPTPARASPKPTLKIREAAPGDAAALAALLEELGFPSGPKDLRTRLAALRRVGEPPLVADEDGPIGCLAWHATPVLHRPTSVGRVTMLVVTKAARGRGVGSALIEEAEARLKQAGCALIEVTSNIELGGAHEFYKSRGYRRTSYRFVKDL